MKKLDKDQQYKEVENQFVPHRGALILILGVLGFVVCGIFGIVAWIMGVRDQKKMQDSIMDPKGMELTRIGTVVGIIGVVIWTLLIFYLLISYLLGASLFRPPEEEFEVAWRFLSCWGIL